MKIIKETINNFRIILRKLLSSSNQVEQKEAAKVAGHDIAIGGKKMVGMPAEEAEAKPFIK